MPRGTEVVGRPSHPGLAEDTSACRQLGRALEASELRYRRLFEAAKDGILILDAATAEIVDVNPFLCQLLGLSRDQVMGRMVWELGPFLDVPASQVNFRTLQQTEYIRYDDLPLESADGRKIAVEFVSNLYLAAGKKVIQCNIRDITQRKRTEEALRASEALNRNLVEHLPHRILVKDRRSVMVFCNGNYARDLGLEPRDIIGRDAFAFYPRELAEEYHADDQEVMTNEVVKDVEERYQIGTEERWIHTVKVPFRDDLDAVVGVLCVFEDITDRRRLEEQLRQSQKLDAIGQLAGGVAHDFNNLLGVITGYGEVVLRQLPERDPLRGKVGQILDAAQRAAGLTRQLLAFGRKQVVQPRALDLNAVISDMETMLRRVLGEQVELVVRKDTRLGSVLADPGQLEQILMNLAINARDAMPRGGRIDVSTCNVELDAAYVATHLVAVPGSYVCLAFSDDGSGMEAATKARIFEPFFSTEETGKGTGLGLSTVYGIVKQCAGNIWVYSEPGVGTTFKMYLPRIDVKAQLVREADASVPLGGSETILLVEDKEDLRELFRETLQASGYSVLMAGDGAEALRVAGAFGQPIELMVTDVIMAGLTGPQTVALVAQTRPDMRVLYISGFDDGILADGSTSRGRAFLAKPFSLKTLLARVRQLLDGG